MELRINLLGPYVDGFVICEGDLTHSGAPKQFLCKQMLQQLQIDTTKIEVIETHLPTLEQTANNWHRERQQRDAAAQLFEDDAVYFVSDCDEIPNPKLIEIFAQAAWTNQHHIFRLNLAWLNARADLRVCDPQAKDAQFCVPYVCTKAHTLDHSLSEIREDQACQLNVLPFPSRFLQDESGDLVDCGWHFSWMGGRSAIKTKMLACAHSRDPQQGIFQTAVGAVNSEQMHSYIDSYQPRPGSHDPYGRSDYFLKHYPHTNLPTLLLESTHLHNYFFGEFK